MKNKFTHLLSDRVYESAVSNVGVEPRYGLSKVPAGRRRHQELEVRRFDFFVDGNMEGNEPFATFDRAAPHVHIAVAGTWKKIS